MRKILAWTLTGVLVVLIAVLYHKGMTKEYEDTIIDYIDLEDLIEEEVNNKNIEVITTTNNKDTNYNKSGDNENISGEKVNVDSSKENLDNKSNDTKLEVMSNSYASLSNKTNAWGFVRKPNGAQPEFHGPYTKVLNDYEGIYVGNKNEPIIYLTFDEGYENGYTGSILDTLREKDVTAVFFVTMPYVKQNPDLIKRMIDEGHIVGNHTVNHPSMPEVTDDTKLAKEITELHDYIAENFNYQMSYLRPPKGEYSERTVKLSLDLGYKTVLWSAAYDDWDRNNQKGSEYAKKMIYNNLHNGCVMLLHAVSKDNATVLGEAIDEIRNRGYEFASLDDFDR